MSFSFSSKVNTFSFDHSWLVYDDNIEESFKDSTTSGYSDNILNLEKALNISGLQIPKTSIKPLPSKIKSIIKPLFSSGGLNINFYKKDKNNFYYQEFIPGPTFSISFFIKKKKFFLLGYNRLFTLKNFHTNPFIHAGAMKIPKIKKFTNIER